MELGWIKEYAGHLRTLGCRIDSDPAQLQALLALPETWQIAYLGVAAPYNPFPLRIGAQTFCAIELRDRLRILEELAYGDAAVPIGLPGPGLANGVIEHLANTAQKELFYGTLERTLGWSCFALTEPQVGSDATAIETRIKKHPTSAPQLFGVKMLVGHAAHACTGVVFLRENEGPVGVRAAIITEAQLQESRREVLPTVGLRCAQLARIEFGHLDISQDQFLGQHLSPARRGMVGAMRSFAKYRPCLAALALGLSRAVLDYVVEQRRSLTAKQRNKIAQMQIALNQARWLLFNLPEGDLERAGIIKNIAVTYAERVTASAVEDFLPGSLLQDPWLNLAYRNARGFEYMEGTSTIHALAACRLWEMEHRV